MINDTLAQRATIEQRLARAREKLSKLQCIIGIASAAMRGKDDDLAGALQAAQELMGQLLEDSLDPARLLGQHDEPRLPQSNP